MRLRRKLFHQVERAEESSGDTEDVQKDSTMPFSVTVTVAIIDTSLLINLATR